MEKNLIINPLYFFNYMYSFIGDMGWVVGAVAGVGLEVRGQFRGADSVLCGVPGIKLGSSALVASSFIC